MKTHSYLFALTFSLVSIFSHFVFAENTIVYGTETTLTQFPWQVSLQYNEIKGGLHFCGGAIISKRHILTAAHCIDPKHPFDVKAGGDGSLAQLRPLSAVKKVSIHPFYDENRHYTLGHDIAVVELSQDIPFTAETQPVNLPSKSLLQNASWATASQSLAISGWGYTEHRTPATQLKFVMGLYPDESLKLTDGMLGFKVKNHQTSCEGDSGSAMVLMNIRTVIALSSYGAPDCLKRDKFYYTSVLPDLAWIYSAL